MKHSISWGKRAVAAAGVAALTLPALAGTATADDQRGIPVAGTDAILTIYKYDTTKATEADKEPTGADGQTVPADAKPLAGAVFTAYPVCIGGTPIDLDTADGWKAIDGITSAAELEKKIKATTTDDAESKLADWSYGASCGTPVTFDATAADGKAEKKLDHKFYLVRETTAPSGVSTPAADFVVTLPMTNATGTDWLKDASGKYHVYAYPKNKLNEPAKKEIVSTKTSIGDVPSNNDVVTFKMTASLDALTDGATYLKSVTITDNLDEAYALPTSFDPATDVTVAVTRPGTPNATTVTVTGKYTVSPAKGAVSDSTKKTLTVSFTPDAKSADSVQANDKISYLQPGDKIEVTFTTKFVGSAGDHLNTFTLTQVDDKDSKNVTPKDPGKTYVKMGTFKAVKVDSQDTTKKLAGAKFKACVAGTDTQKDQCASPAVYAKTADDLSTTGQDESADAIFTSNSNGEITGTLLIGKGTDPSQVTSKRYCLVEDTAPAGYKKTTAVSCFDVTVDAEANVGNIENTFDSGSWIPGLPKTGAAGQVLLVLGGAALAAIAVGSALVIRRRQA